MASLGVGILIALLGLFCGYDWRSVRYPLHNLLVREKERVRGRERGQERVSVSLFTLCALLLMIIMDMESSNQQVKKSVSLCRLRLY